MILSTLFLPNGSIAALSDKKRRPLANGSDAKSPLTATDRSD
jgi:hypothetical protein